MPPLALPRLEIVPSQPVQTLIDTLQLLKTSSVFTYDQDWFGDVSETRPAICLASAVFVQEYGKDFYFSYARSRLDKDCIKLSRNITRIACDNLGIPYTGVTPQIFCKAVAWRWDLCRAYYDSRTNEDRLDVAIQALMRMKPDGSIRPIKAWSTPYETPYDTVGMVKNLVRSAGISSQVFSAVFASQILSPTYTAAEGRSADTERKGELVSA